ncbi:MAG TPA: MFS transporter [Kofleriaceae bacterium]|nr:MFS transporter [Kofleriaceae bacterium]
MPRLLERLALHRPELRAWAYYDLANSAFITIVITAVFPDYFNWLAADALSGPLATGRFVWATSISLAVIAVLSPILGAMADHAPIKKRFLAAFMLLGVAATAGLGLAHRGDWVLALVLFGLGNIGATGSFVFYDSMLPHIASEDEVDRVSTAGYALGYLGGGALLAFVIVTILAPATFGLADAAAASRLGFVLVAVWWLVFSVPLFLRVPEPPATLRPDRPRGLGLVRASFAGLLVTFRELRRFRQATLLLFAFLIYNDGIGTIIRVAVIYGKEIGLATPHLITAVLITQFIGIPFTFLFGGLAGRIGTKTAVYIGLVVYCIVSTLGYFMTTALHFYLLAVLVGMVQGGVQALSRSLFASMIPRARSSEMFALFGVFEKFAGIFGPGLFGLMLALTGSSRAGILSVIAFFVVGGLLLAPVDVHEGRRAARAADAAA